jgi:hypothetical protein
MKPRSPEHRAALAASSRRLWTSPEYRAKFRATTGSAEYRAKFRATTGSAEYRAKFRATLRASPQAIAARAKNAEAARLRALARPGHSRTRTARAWMNMRYRCRNPNCHSWKDYGGRGITVCPVRRPRHLW